MLGERWAKVVFRIEDGLGVHWCRDSRQVEAQDAVLRSVVLPILSSGQWFFRRRDLPHEDARQYNDGLIILVRLDAADRDPEGMLRDLTAALRAAGHALVSIGEWDGNAGHNDGHDGDPLADGEWREFCCAVADAYLRTGGRAAAKATAMRWLRGAPPWGERLVHWLCWIAGDPDKRARLTEFGILG